MRADILKLVRELSACDTKTLSQKALKTVEEVGELAKKVLPFESASGTAHRIVQSHEIAEECVDTLLCALSILYELDYSDEQVEQLMAQKSAKWASLQQRESKAAFPVPFEIHVTVENLQDIDGFKATCMDLGVKPLFLALQDQSGDTVLNQVMTSSVMRGDNQQALAQANHIAKVLESKGFEVTRRKIETVPWHPAAPSQTSSIQEMPKGAYFEAHFKVRVTGACESAIAEKELLLSQFCKENNLHFSRNIFKLVDKLDYTRMMTLRMQNCLQEEFQARVEIVRKVLLAMGFDTPKTDTEFSLFDSDIHNDAQWIGEPAALVG